MKDNCLDIGIIQAFLDCELDQAETARVSGHISMCNDCAVLLAQAEDESSMVFSALEREFNTLVPTQRLWNKINDSIETERETPAVLGKSVGRIRGCFCQPVAGCRCWFIDRRWGFGFDLD
jgi:anti-sigma factor RsiW